MTKRVKVCGAPRSTRTQGTDAVEHHLSESPPATLPFTAFAAAVAVEQEAVDVTGFPSARFVEAVVPPLVTSNASIHTQAPAEAVTVSKQRRLRRLAETRAGESLCTFARAFDRRATDFWVVRAVYEELRPYCRFRGRQVPVRPTDSLTDDLHIDGDDLEGIARDATARVGRVFENLAGNPWYGRVDTIGDMVAFEQHQPKLAPPAA